MASDLWFWSACSGNALYPECPGVMLDRATSRAVLRHPWSWDIGPSTSAAQTSLNMVQAVGKPGLSA